MHGAALHVYRVGTFPDLALEQTFATQFQAGLLPEVDDGPSTKVTLQGVSDHPEFDRYLCEHQEVRSVMAVWRRHDINSLTMKHWFHVFRHRTRRDLVFARGNRRIVGAAMKRLNGDPRWTIGYDTVDIHALASELRSRRATLHAAYFSDLTLRKVRAATLYGEDVDQSEEYDHLDQAGILSAITVEATLDGVPEKFLVTHRRTIVVLHHNNERPQLVLGLKVNALIEEALPPGPAPRNA